MLMSSKKYLKRLPTTGEQVLEGPGENAGVVAIGDGLAVVFKIESHNHPSQVMPVEGAATGIGGVVRDVYCMGAEVIGVLDAPYAQVRAMALSSAGWCAVATLHPNHTWEKVVFDPWRQQTWDVNDTVAISAPEADAEAQAAYQDEKNKLIESYDQLTGRTAAKGKAGMQGQDCRTGRLVTGGDPG